MSPEVNDDTFTDLAVEERRRLGRKGTSGPLVRFGLVLLAFVVAVVIIGLVVRAVLHSREVSSYQAYMTQVAKISKESDRSGQALAQLLKKPGDATRKEVQTVLDGYVASSNKLEAQAKALPVPDDLKEAHQWFLAVLQLRAQGFEDLKPSLLNALEVRDLDLASEQIANAMQLLLLSDVAYDRVFAPRASDVLKKKDIAGLTVPRSAFLADPTLATTARVKEILASLKSSQSLQSIHGVAATKLTAMPSEKVIASGNTYNLQSTDKLAFDVTVENQGNNAEKNVPVTLKLSTQSQAQPQIVSIKIDELKPKETKTVTIKGVNPAAYGEDALLRVEVGPVPGEKNKENNVIEAHVIFVL
jgi:hypothetical protein